MLSTNVPPLVYRDNIVSFVHTAFGKLHVPPKKVYPNGTVIAQSTYPEPETVKGAHDVK